MATVPADVRDQLVERRERVQTALGRGANVSQLEQLLGEIDAALERYATGTYGVCETCGDPIEADRLHVDPLVRFCLDHLTPHQARALELDLQLASRVQLNLLPPADLTVDGWQAAYHYEPLSTVSGDYVDIVRPSGARDDFFFLFGDIAGKGVAASMLMAHLNASVRTLIDLGLPIGQVMERANRVFCESTMANHYATLVCGKLTAGGDLDLCNAGHCPPILVHDGETTTIEPTSVPVGLFCVKEFPSRRVEFSAGDTLLLYTDGLTEALDRDGGEYGVDRVVSLVRSHASKTAQALVSACVRDFEEFRAGAARTDDVSVMAIKRL
jgi:sigma-B regulation protein RsbU (phosphoserine phosphatase)